MTELSLLDEKHFVTFFPNSLSVQETPVPKTLHRGLHLLPELLTSDECDSIICNSEAIGFTQVDSRYRLLCFESNGVLLSTLRERLNESGSITMIDMETATTLNWAPPSLVPPGSTWSVMGGELNPCLRVTKYENDGSHDRFEWHRDASFTDGGSCRSAYTLIVYLTGDCDSSCSEGGETEFLLPQACELQHHKYQLCATIEDEVSYLRNSRQYDVVKVSPKKGMGVLFDQRLLHRGSVVTHGTKFILRTDLLFTCVSSCSSTNEFRHSSLHALTTKLFRKAQLLELDGEHSKEAKQLYDLVLAIRSNWKDIDDIPEWVHTIVDNLPTRSTPGGGPHAVCTDVPLQFIESDGFNNTYHFPATVSCISAVTEYIKIAILHALTVSTKKIVSSGPAFSSIIASCRKSGILTYPFGFVVSGERVRCEGLMVNKSKQHFCDAALIEQLLQWFRVEDSSSTVRKTLPKSFFTKIFRDFNARFDPPFVRVSEWMYKMFSDIYFPLRKEPMKLAFLFVTLKRVPRKDQSRQLVEHLVLFLMKQKFPQDLMDDESFYVGVPALAQGVTKLPTAHSYGNGVTEYYNKTFKLYKSVEINRALYVGIYMVWRGRYIPHRTALHPDVFDYVLEFLVPTMEAYASTDQYDTLIDLAQISTVLKDDDDEEDEEEDEEDNEDEEDDEEIRDNDDREENTETTRQPPVIPPGTPYVSSINCERTRGEVCGCPCGCCESTAQLIGDVVLPTLTCTPWDGDTEAPTLVLHFTPCHQPNHLQGNVQMWWKGVSFNHAACRCNGPFDPYYLHDKDNTLSAHNKVEEILLSATFQVDMDGGIIRVTHVPKIDL